MQIEGAFVTHCCQGNMYSMGKKCSNVIGRGAVQGAGVGGGL